MISYTKRLILRPFTERDAESVYYYAKDPEVGPVAGWPPHQSVEESLNVIRTVFSADETYAICLKEDNNPIGAVGLKPANDMSKSETECEIGYWLGKPFWGMGIMTEAASEIVRHAFHELGMEAVWAGHYDGNIRSRRVMEKCGFEYHHTTEKVSVPLLGEERCGHIFLLTREKWERLYEI